MVFPEQLTGWLFGYTRTDPDGALVFSTIATMGQLGDVVTKLTNGTFEYRYADEVTAAMNQRITCLTPIADRRCSLEYWLPALANVEHRCNNLGNRLTS